MPDILSHELVPRHEVLSPQEKKGLLERLHAKTEHLPKIFLNDPVVKLIKAKPDDVIKITRKSPTAGETHYYRAVVEG